MCMTIVCEILPVWRQTRDAGRDNYYMYITLETEEDYCVLLFVTKWITLARDREHLSNIGWLEDDRLSEWFCHIVYNEPLVCVLCFARSWPQSRFAQLWPVYRAHDADRLSDYYNIDGCAQWYAHKCKQFLQMTVGLAKDCG